MLVVTTIRLSKGFQAWKDMVHSVGDKMKEHGMTFVFAGTQKDDESNHLPPMFKILLISFLLLNTVYLFIVIKVFVLMAVVFNLIDWVLLKEGA